MDAPIRFAKDIARRLGEMPGMAAVAHGGSWARGQGDPDSEVGLRVYYRPEDPPPAKPLHELAQELDERRLPNLATDDMRSSHDRRLIRLGSGFRLRFEPARISVVMCSCYIQCSVTFRSLVPCQHERARSPAG